MRNTVRIGAVCFQEYSGDYLEFIDLAHELELSWVELKHEPPICLKKGSGKYTEIKNKAAGLGIGLSLHTPFVGLNIASIDEGERRTSFERIKESLLAASKMGIHYATIHGGHLKSQKYSDVNWKRSQELNIISLKELVSFGSDIGVTLCLENGNSFKRKFLKLALHPGEMKYIRNEVGPGLRYTVDFGHAMYFSLDPSYLISELGRDNVKLTHLHSNYQLNDTHNPLGEGYLFLDKIVDRYVCEEWNFPLSIEMKNEADLKKSVNFLYAYLSEKGYKKYGTIDNGREFL